MKALLPANEAARLQALHRYHILDSAAEQAVPPYMTKIAAYIAQTPIALISLVDRDRQWFKSRIGLETVETPRELLLRPRNRRARCAVDRARCTSR